MRREERENTTVALEGPVILREDEAEEAIKKLRGVNVIKEDEIVWKMLNSSEELGLERIAWLAHFMHDKGRL